MNLIANTEYGIGGNFTERYLKTVAWTLAWIIRICTWKRVSCVMSKRHSFGNYVYSSIIYMCVPLYVRLCERNVMSDLNVCVRIEIYFFDVRSGVRSIARVNEIIW
jgi:hypothetical protein